MLTVVFIESWRASVFGRERLAYVRSASTEKCNTSHVETLYVFNFTLLVLRVDIFCVDLVMGEFSP